MRQAFYQAIDVDGIIKNVMRGAATPNAQMLPPQVKGFAPDLAKRLPFDPEASKKLLAEAGYPSGFEVKLNCPNDRYVNDAAICQAVAANLARVGVKINWKQKPRAPISRKSCVATPAFTCWAGLRARWTRTTSWDRFCRPR